MKFRNQLFRTASFGVLALAPAAPLLADETQALPLEEIVITGSRIRRTDTATAAPISVIDQQTMTDRGFVSAGQLLAETPSTTVNIPLSPFNGQSSGGGEQLASLLGLGPGRTLTLVNGRRFVSTASGFGTTGQLAGSTNESVVDTNIIPTGLLSRVEVLQGGGSVVYGTDAMAGVINYILRDDFEGFEADAQYGRSSRGDYPVKTGRATWGTNLAQRGNIAVNVEWSRTEPLFAEDRPASARARVTSSNPANTNDSDGIPAVASVFNTTFWEFNRNGVLFAPPNPTCFPSRCFITLDGVPYNQFTGTGVPAQFNAAGTDLVPFDPGAFSSNGPSIPFASGGDGFSYRDIGALFSGVERTSATAIGHYDLTDNIVLSGEALYSQASGEDPRSNIILNMILNGPQTGSAGIPIRADNPYLPASAIPTISNYLNNVFGPGAGNAWVAGAPLPVTLSKVWPDILPSYVGTRDIETARAVLALDGDFEWADRELYWNLSAIYARTDGEIRAWNIRQDHFANAIDARRSGADIVCAINADADPTNDDPACAPINPFGAGNVSEAARNYVSALFGRDYENTQADYLATLGGELFSVPGGEIKFSLTYEHRTEEATFTPTEAARLGLGRAPSESPQSGDYYTNEISAELLVPLVSGAMGVPLVDSFEINAAFRNVDHSIAGTEDVWDLGVRWSIVQDVALRVSRSRNFRAPNLAQLFAPTTVGLAAIGQDPCDADQINGGPNPAVRLANCQALFAANPGYGPLASFQDLSENFPIAQIATGGNPDLRNELSDTWTYGIILQPRFVAGLTIVVDRIEIDLTDGLSFFQPANFLATCFDSPTPAADICAVSTRDATGQIIASAARTLNAGSIAFRGETYAIDYTFGDRSTWGEIELNLEAIHVGLLETSVTGLDRTRTDDTALAPEWRASFDANYNRGPLRVSYTLNYLPETFTASAATIENNPNPVLAANYVHSISAQYQLMDSLWVRAGVRNFTDEEPSFPSLSYGDILGRQWFVGATARF